MSEKFNAHNPDHLDPTKYRIQEGTVFAHTMAAIRVNKEENNPTLNLAILFHDIGKPDAFVPRGEKKTYHSHDIIGKKIIEKVCRRLKINNDYCTALCFCAENHMKFHNISEMKKAKVAPLLIDINSNTLQKVTFADDSCRTGCFDEDTWKATLVKIQSVKDILNSDMYKRVNGKLVMTLTGCASGPIIGKILLQVRGYILNNFNDVTEASVDKNIIGAYKSRKTECQNS